MSKALPPVSGTVYGTLLNYKGELDALGDAVNRPPYQAPPRGPIMYIKPVNTIIGYGKPIPLPEDVQELSMGAALGIVIGKTATRVNESEALDYIAGYTVVNDVSIPHSSVYRPAIKQKIRDGFCPVGPCVIERDAVDNPDDLTVRVKINGDVRQENTTKHLIRPAAKLIADVTDFMTLSAGNILLVGVPENAPLAKAGDRVRIEIDGVGCVENTVVREDELKRGKKQ
ncbi:5-carboxy-2-oxohept-3-enedioate decarboxylase HpaG1 subunit [Scopulibacillus darangshiensis]|uniref:5-carboxy-2-oxohept-3-enedioate decarboxylase HpaG1 subunit n=1 Tax=Scopulibacillus darangshiensis TaxID=442528 RepID=A0A4R2P945_9BACL|nr:fumarylacetoacetate hydrolase family protein [Scopulibacillus darangshiensis]TCP30858.1 5-carboxy-2-oxohept-3-enedioate decarboxylase HpaG1 subunit [Scopulibacillus darangshiensis]